MPDPDLEMGGGRGGGGSSRPLDKGRGQSPTQFFRPFGPQFRLKIRGSATSSNHDYQHRLTYDSDVILPRLVGSFRNDDSGGNENVKKVVGL